MLHPSLRFATDERILQDCRWEAFRASGPGGQKRNKTSSAIRLTHAPTGIAAIANESRSQAANRAAALRRLRHRMMIELREPIDPAGFAPAPWFAKLCPHGRLSVPGRSPLYLPAGGLVLDMLAVCDWSVSVTAEHLGLSTGNLVRFLQQDEKILAPVNNMRARVNLNALGSD